MNIQITSMFILQSWENCCLCCCYCWQNLPTAISSFNFLSKIAFHFIWKEVDSAWRRYFGIFGVLVSCWILSSDVGRIWWVLGWFIWFILRWGPCIWLFLSIFRGFAVTSSQKCLHRFIWIVSSLVASPLSQNRHFHRPHKDLSVLCSIIWRQALSQKICIPSSFSLGFRKQLHLFFPSS